jgi:ribosome-binding protein aMBF1 (putative translation factor)
MISDDRRGLCHRGRVNHRRASRRALPKLRAAFGRRLRELRGRRGWSQVMLGARAGVSAKFIGEVERGEKSISLDNLAYVARALRVPLATIVKRLEARER